MKVDLTHYNTGDYETGANTAKRILWYLVNALVFDSWLFPWSSMKSALLKAFGAELGPGTVIKPRVNIKYPWNLSAGKNLWLGEGVWIDSLAPVRLGSNVCISQDAYLLTGNHNYTITTFPLIVKGITVEDGAWIGARATICPGVTIRDHTVITVASVVTKDTESHGIYQGNPAVLIKTRVLRSPD